VGAVICVIEDEEVIAAAIAAAEGLGRPRRPCSPPATPSGCTRWWPTCSTVAAIAAATPAFRRHYAGCLSDDLRGELAEPDGLAGLNLARSRARELLATAPACS
jgi:hypothetical protein